MLLKVLKYNYDVGIARWSLCVNIVLISVISVVFELIKKKRKETGTTDFYVL